MKRLFDRIYRAAGIALLSTSVFAADPPGMPITYWSCPPEQGAGCNSGVYRDGLLIQDGESVAIMFDCDNNSATPLDQWYEGREKDVSKGQYPLTKDSSSTRDVNENNPPDCGYSTDPAETHLRVGHMTIAGKKAFINNGSQSDLSFDQPGSSNQERFDIYELKILMPDKTTLDWYPGIPEANKYSAILFDLNELQATGNFANITATPIICGTQSTSISGTPELTGNPDPGGVYGYLARGENESEIGNWGRATAGTRGNPILECFNFLKTRIKYWIFLQ